MSHDLCTEQEITTLVHQFYARIRDDDQLAPVFDAQIQDWDEHLKIMVNFWSALLRGTARFQGRPMPKHAALPELNEAMFHRWLMLFDMTTQELDNVAMARRAQEFARRIARQLWMGYQIKNFPQQAISDLDVTVGPATQ